MKQVLSVQDLSCVGRCSLTVALPVLSAMGLQCSVLPTAVLSTHTGFPAPHVRDLSEDLLPVLAHWKSVGAAFDTVSVGYLASPDQVEAVAQVLDAFPDACVVLDPVMGDHGRLYSRITPAHVDALKKLCRRADYILPNVTEAAALTGFDYRDHAGEDYLSALTEAMLSFGAKAVVITGGSSEAGKTGFAGGYQDRGQFRYRAPLIPRQLHGTGDLFAAVFAGALTQGAVAEDAATQAARFVERCIAATERVTPYGVEFETQLSYLMK